MVPEIGYEYQGQVRPTMVLIYKTNGEDKAYETSSMEHFQCMLQWLDPFNLLTQLSANFESRSDYVKSNFKFVSES